MLDERALYKAAIDIHGHEKQLRRAQEELSILVTSISRFARGKIDEETLAKDVSDAEIIIGQLRLMLGEDVVNEAKCQRLEILENKINEYWRGEQVESQNNQKSSAEKD